MLNELYTFAEPVQVVPFSSLKWGKFTLLHTVERSPKPRTDPNWLDTVRPGQYQAVNRAAGQGGGRR